MYPHLAHLAGGQVYPYVVPLLDGRPSVALPWVVFSLISSVSADVMGGQAESSVSVQIDVLCRDCDAGASDTSGRP
ncbi:FIG00638104: hypothetical protein [Escherichia coli ISC41]|nr:FIG00638104: hypothetical protein [Escherichia coli ISC41]